MKWRMMLFALVILFAMGVQAQTVPEVKISVQQSHTAVTPGNDLDLFIKYEIPENYHLTENFFEVVLQEQTGFSAGLQQITSGEFEKGEIVRRGSALIKLPITVAESVNPQDYNLKLSASYQICREIQPETCFPPSDKSLSLMITVLEPGQKMVSTENAKTLEAAFSGPAETDTTEPLSDDDTTETLDGRLKKALAQGSIIAFVIVFFAGFLTSLTPCVYPMIPITISYIGGRSAGQGKFRGFTLSLFYVLGLALIYAVLGVAAALTGSLFGSITQTPAVLGGVALIFGVMGLSMLGLFDLQLPSSLQGKMQSGGPKGGFIGAISMGAVAGLVAAPCAGPVIVALMTYIASTGKVIFGFTLMMSFAAGMGILFIILGTFSGLLSALPSAGMWMDSVKKVFGVIMLGAALFIAKPIMPPPLFGFLMGLGMVLLGAGMGAFRSIDGHDPRKKDLIKGVAIILVVFGVYSIVHLIPVPGRIVPDQSSSSHGVIQEEVEDIWRQDLETALNDAKNSKKLMVLDFGAEWCHACKELEHKTFTDAEVKKHLKEMIAVKIDCTESRNPEIKKVQQQYGVTGLPTVIVLDPEGLEISRFVSFIPPDAFIKFLKQAQKEYAEFNTL